MKTFTINQNQKSDYVKPVSFCIFILMLLFSGLNGIPTIQCQTFGPPLFTEDFGTVPIGTSNVNAYRGVIDGRGTIGISFWFWPATCTGTGLLTNNPPTLETSYALVLPAREQGITEWVFIPVTVMSGTPYNGANLNNPANTWCLNGTTWAGPNPSSCAGTYVRWYNVYGTWKLGHWERYKLKTSVSCSAWHSTMDDGGYALSANPKYVHGADGTNSDWRVGAMETAFRSIYAMRYGITIRVMMKITVLLR